MCDRSIGETVSIVIPAYKHESFIIETLESVKSQIYPHLELIVVDDRSPDRTLELAAEWLSTPANRSRFTSVKLLRNERNSGAHASINRGIAESSGSIVSLLNSDDLYHPQRTTKLVSALAQEGTDFAFSKVLPVNDDGDVIPPWKLPDQLKGVFDFADRVWCNFPSLSFGFLAQNMAVSTGNFVFRRELYHRIGPFKHLLYVHDWEFLLRVILECEPAYVPEELYLYRIHSANSFSQLGNVAEVEGLIVSETFYRNVQRSPTRNALAPVHDNWPEVWEMLRPLLGSILSVGPWKASYHCRSRNRLKKITRRRRTTVQ